MSLKIIAHALAGLMLMSATVQAHHSFVSQYDADTSFTLEGKVTEVWFQNPHSRVYVEVIDDDGNAVLWETETFPRNILIRRGWKHDALNIGDTVVVTGRRARNEANRLQIISITRPSDGWKGIGFEAESID